MVFIAEFYFHIFVPIKCESCKNGQGPGCGEEESFLMVNLLLMEVMLKGSWPLMNFSQIQTQRA
ncbi:hypothetical protein HanPSC8_Chr15g0654231 [Helianthus annuus]|nr:hypothetical protein HanPSC8_Chr15g0654231 [Helianthus annuus]